MIAITGISGLTGANLARSLLAQGEEVRGLAHHDRRAVAGLAVELIQGDVCDPASLHRLIEGAELVYHLAARISLDRSKGPEIEEINVLGTRNVVETCLRCGVRRLVHFSSIHALEQEPLDVPLDESRRRVSSQIRSPYDRSKALGEQEVLDGVSRGLQAVILNPTGMIGPYDYYPSFMGKALLALARGRIPALVSGGFDWVDVRDVVAAAITAGQSGENGASYILSGHWRSVRQVADATAEVTGIRSPQLTVPTWLAYLAAPWFAALAGFNGSEPIFTPLTLDALKSNRHISHARASRDLGFKARPFVETIQDTIAWFVLNSYLKFPTRSMRIAHD